MVAEAVKEVTDATPPEDATLSTPEAAPESPVEVENQEESTDYGAIFEAFADPEGTSDADGKGAATDGQVPATPATPQTPEEIKAAARQEVLDEAARAKADTDYRNYVAGLQHVVQTTPAKLNEFIEKHGLGVGDYNELLGMFNNVNGAYKPLYEHSVKAIEPQIKQAAYQENADEISRQFRVALTEDLGETAVKAVEASGAKDWVEATKAVIKEARKGLFTEEQARAKNNKVLANIDKALEAHGLSLKAITGNGGTTKLPPMTGGSAGQPKNYAEAEAWHASGKWDNAQMRAYKATHSRD